MVDAGPLALDLADAIYETFRGDCFDDAARQQLATAQTIIMSLHHVLNYNEIQATENIAAAVADAVALLNDCDPRAVRAVFVAIQLLNGLIDAKDRVLIPFTAN